MKTLIYRPHHAKIKYALLVEGHQPLGDTGVPVQNVFSNFRKLVVGFFKQKMVTRVVVIARRARTSLVPTDSRIGARASDDEEQA